MGDLDPQNVDTLLIQSQAVIDFVVAPGNDVDHQVDDVLPLDGTHAKELCHIDEADAPELNVVPDQVRRGAHETGGGDFFNLHRIVCNEPVAPLDELHSGLTLADATLPHQEQALAVHVRALFR